MYLKKLAQFDVQSNLSSSPPVTESNLTGDFERARAAIAQVNAAEISAGPGAYGRLTYQERKRLRDAPFASLEDIERWRDMCLEILKKMGDK